jgi:hypothetical protein
LAATSEVAWGKGVTKGLLGIIFNIAQGTSLTPIGNLVGEAKRLANRKRCLKGGKKSGWNLREYRQFLLKTLKRFNRTTVGSQIFLAVDLSIWNCRTKR